jgi:cytoskeleton protein RodZ
LAALPQVANHRAMGEGEKTALNQPFRLPGDAKFSWSKIPISMPMMAAALVLLLAAVVLIFLPNLTKEAETFQAQSPVVPAAPTLITPSAPIFIPPPEPAVPPIAAKIPVAVVSVPAMTASAPVIPSIANPILRIEAKGVVWVEVKDSKGTILIQRTLQAKEVASVSGQPPLAVVVGRINEIASVQVRGKPFSLDGMSPDNVARFEVK